MTRGGEAPAAAGLLLPFTLGWLAGGLHRANAGGAVLAVFGALLAVGIMRRRDPAPVALAGAAAGIALGALAAVLAQLPPPSGHVARLVGVPLVAVEGTIVRSEREGDRVSLAVHAEHVRSRARSGPVTGLLGVTIAHAASAWPSGTRVRLVGKLRRPHSFANPGAYDHAAALRRRGIRATLFLWDETRVTRLDGAATTAGRIDGFRADLTARIAGRTTEPVRGYLTAVLLGATQSLDRDTRAALTRTGLAHVVSVSGFHVAVAAGACVLGLRWLLLRLGTLALRIDVTVLAATAGVAPVAAYAAVAGGTIPATRAFLTYGVVVAVLATGRPPDGLRVLALIALLMATSAPDVAADVSFELSFVAVLALLLLTRRRQTARALAITTSSGSVADTPTVRQRWWRHLVVTPIATSLAASAATAPLTAWHFQQVSLISPLANLLALPLLGPATLLPGLAALPLFAPFPGLADGLLTLASGAAGLGLAVAKRLAALPGAAVDTPMPSLLEVALCYGIVGLGWWRVRLPGRDRRWRFAALGLAVVIVLDLGYWAWERCANPTLRVTFLAVGQGDAAVVELPRGGVMVIDGGGLPGDFDTGGRVIAPFLRARKIMRVDVLVLSHPQLDHFGGLAHLAEHFAPTEIWSNGMRSTGAAYARLETTLRAAGVRSVVLTRGMARRLDDVVVHVLHPNGPGGLGVNDASLVLRLVHGRMTMLFTGDIEDVAESQLLADGAALASDVLKVPHHGSATSSTRAWLAAVTPRIAVVSSGADNRFGFPAPAVVRRLRAAGATVWNTAEDGAVRVVSDGTDVTVTALQRDAGGVRFELPKSLW